MSAPTANTSDTVRTKRPSKPRHWLNWGTWTVLLGIFVLAVTTAQLRLSHLAQIPSELANLAKLMFFPPNWAKLPEALQVTMESVSMAWLGTAIGITVSFPLGLAATNGLTPAVVRWPLRLLFSVLRTVPEIIIAIMILSITGLTPFTGALAIGVGSIGTLSKWGYETYEAVDRGPLEAVRACGGSRAQVMRWGVWPQSASDMLALWLYRFEVNVRASAILGLIGAGGIGGMLQANISYRVWDTVGILLLTVVAVTVILDQISAMLRARLQTGRWPWHRDGTEGKQAVSG